MMLKLSNAGRLPTLANHCFIVGEAKRADVIWSEGDFQSLVRAHAQREPTGHFLTVWIDSKRESAIREGAAYGRGLTNVRAGRGLPSPERPKSKQRLVFIHQMPKASRVGLQLILMLTTGNTSKRGNGRWKPSRYYSNNRSFTLSFARQVMAYHLFIYTRELHPVGRVDRTFEAGLRMDRGANCGWHL